MREGAHKRLAWAVALVALLVIFVPMMIRDDPLPPMADFPLEVPREPNLDPRFRSESSVAPVAPRPVADPGGEEAIPYGFDDTLPLDLDEAEVVLGGLAPPEPVPEPVDTRPGRAQPPAPPPARPAEPAVRPAPAPPPPAARASGMESWVVQVASVVTPDNASALEARLRAGGFTAFVETADISGQRYYRVRVGPEIERARAERTAERLRAEFNLDPIVQRYP